MKTLREIVTEVTGEIKYSGILKLKLDSQTIASLKKFMDRLPPEANALSEDKLHVTLIHQDILKPYKHRLKGVAPYLHTIPPALIPKVVVTDKIYRIKRPNRESWISVLANQEEMQAFVDRFMEELGGQPAPERRVYHITLANLTGNSADSVGDVRHNDIIGKNLVSNVLQDAENDVK